MSAVRFRTRVRNDSAHLPHTCVSGREGKGREGKRNGRRTSFIVTLVTRGAVDNSALVVARALRQGSDGA